MTLRSLFVDTTTGSPAFVINTKDIQAALRTALIAGVTTAVTVLLTVIPTLPANTVMVGTVSFTPLLVMVSSFLLRVLMQALSHNEPAQQ